MDAVMRSAERLPAEPTERPDSGSNQRRVEEAYRLLGVAAAWIVTDINPSVFILDMASCDGVLQDVWCRDEISAAPIGDTLPTDPVNITGGAFGPVNAERFIRAQKALSALLLELTRPGCSGAATLRLRGRAGEIADDIRGESRRQWRF
jgi:hypothetical protein